MKTLEALERIKEITSTREQGFSLKLKDDPYYEKELDIIEKSLKQREELNKDFLELAEIAHNQAKALEIIKESVVATPNIPIVKADKEKYVEISLAIPVEKYYLLKEVLL